MNRKQPGKTAERSRAPWPRRLLGWFARARRAMPWRDRPEPYAVWISEIMLQQTQVATARPFFDRFMTRFPSLSSLAQAPEDEVLHAWQGLGYYARARHLHRAAKALVMERGGEWPRTAAEWRVLPGVGDYTAAAIASIVFGEAVPSVDGNVIRVFSRFWRLPGGRTDPALRRAIAARLDAVMPRRAAGDFNQAMMELGALVCTPRRPACGDCPLARDCAAHRAGCEEDFPARPPARRLACRHRVAVVLRRADTEAVLLRRRPDTGLLGGLWDLPGEPRTQGETDRQALARLLRDLGVPPGEAAALLHASIARPLDRILQVYSHFKEETRVFEGGIAAGFKIPADGRWRSPATAGRLPLTALARRFLADPGATEC